MEELENKPAFSAEKVQRYSEIFISTNSLVSYLGVSEAYSSAFLEGVQKHMGRKVESMTSVFNYSLQRGDNFHHRTDGRHNLLLLCLTEDDQLIGGFSESGFSMSEATEKEGGFLFNFREGKMQAFKLKRGKRSTEYDWDFLVFGHE